MGDAISKLEEELWYFHSERKQYAFRNQPNLNRVIMDREETISNERIRDELNNYIQKNAGKALEIYLWPEEAKDIPDNKNLKLVILSPEFSYDSEKGKKLASEFFEKAGAGFRVYKNTLFILAMDEAHYLTLSKSLKRFLALTELLNNKGLLESITKESQEELKMKLKEAEKDIPFKILSAYRYLAMLEERGLSWKDLGIPTIGASVVISERVRQYLKDQEKILSRLTPKYIIDRTFSKDEDEKILQVIYELFLKAPGMPLLENEAVLFNAVKEGVKTGFIGIREDQKVYYGQDVSPNMESVILRGEKAKDIKEKEKEVGKRKEGEVTIEEPKVEHKPIGGVRYLTVEAKIPYDKLSSIISGVIRPLKEKGHTPEIIVEIKAEAEQEFDRTTLDTRVKETLNQIGAEILKWEEK